MGLFVKICGVTDLETAETVVHAGADAIGFVFADSPRRVTPRQAVAISGDLPPHLRRIAVFRNPALRDIEAALEVFTPDLVQADHQALVGFEGVDTLPVFREGSSGDPDDGRFLYEGPVSGSGQAVHLGRAADMARLGAMVLAGGLHPHNVGSAIATVRPHGVDVSSGVESSPGTKDPALIRSFVAAARVAEERLVNV